MGAIISPSNLILQWQEIILIKKLVITNDSAWSLLNQFSGGKKKTSQSEEVFCCKHLSS